MTAPTFDPGPCEGLSSFQRSHVRALVTLPEFSHFVLVNGSTHDTFQRDRPGPKNVLWYDKQGNLWLDRIGLQKLLRRVGTNEEV
jgi:hypothetical protein